MPQDRRQSVAPLIVRRLRRIEFALLLEKTFRNLRLLVQSRAPLETLEQAAEQLRVVLAEDVKALRGFDHGDFFAGAGDPSPVSASGTQAETPSTALRRGGAFAEPLLIIVREGFEAILLLAGDVFDRGLGRYRIGYSMLEVDRFLPEWVAQANRMDEVWVPSEFNRQGLLTSGVHRPVRVKPLGIDPDYPHPDIEGFPSPLGEQVFLTSFEWGERKEPWMLLRAFNDMFRAEEPVRLVCKIKNRDPSVRLRQEISGLGLRETGGKISYLFDLEFPDHQLGSFYRSGRLLRVTEPRRGLEHAADGGHGLRSAGDRDRLERPPGVSARRHRLSVAHPRHDARHRALPLLRRRHNCAEADEEHLRFLLRHLYEHRDEAARKGAAAAAEVAQRWTWRRAAERIRDRQLEISR